MPMLALKVRKFPPRRSAGSVTGVSKPTMTRSRSGTSASPWAPLGFQPGQGGSHESGIRRDCRHVGVRLHLERCLQHIGRLHTRVRPRASGHGGELKVPARERGHHSGIPHGCCSVRPPTSSPPEWPHGTALRRVPRTPASRPGGCVSRLGVAHHDVQGGGWGASLDRPGAAAGPASCADPLEQDARPATTRTATVTRAPFITPPPSIEVSYSHGVEGQTLPASGPARVSRARRVVGNHDPVLGARWDDLAHVERPGAVDRYARRVGGGGRCGMGSRVAAGGPGRLGTALRPGPASGSSRWARVACVGRGVRARLDHHGVVRVHVGHAVAAARRARQRRPGEAALRRAALGAGVAVAVLGWCRDAVYEPFDDPRCHVNCVHSPMALTSDLALSAQLSTWGATAAALAWGLVLSCSWCAEARGGEIWWVPLRCAPRCGIPRRGDLLAQGVGRGNTRGPLAR